MDNMIVDDEQCYDLYFSYDPECTQPLLRKMTYWEFVQGTIEIKDVDKFL